MHAHEFERGALSAGPLLETGEDSGADEVGDVFGGAVKDVGGVSRGNELIDRKPVRNPAAVTPVFEVVAGVLTEGFQFSAFFGEGLDVGF